MSKKAMIIGAALDFLDDPERVALKRSYLEAAAAGRVGPGLPSDPCDAIAPLILADLNGSAEFFGKVPVPSWLTPRPEPGDLALVDARRCREFLDSGGADAWVEECGAAARSVLPHVPVLIGVDHALAAGPIEAVSAHYGAGRTAVAVLDSHFDAVSAAARADDCGGVSWKNAGHCGDFLAGLLDRGVILPSRLFVIGVGDYPSRSLADTAFGREYLSRIGQGVSVFTKAEACRPGFSRLLQKRLAESGANVLYISLDADVGSCSCMSAVRFMDRVGMAAAAVMGVARALRGLVEGGGFLLGGVDVCEVDVHLLGLPGPDGGDDCTERVCADFVETVLGGQA